MASFYIRNSGRDRWVASIQIYENGKRTQRAFTEEEYRVHGLNKKWTREEAKAEIKKLNLANKVETLKKSKAAQRVSIQKIESSIYLDETKALKYQEYLIENILNNDLDRVKKNRILFHWRTAQKIINKVQLLPEQYFRNSGKFINEFVKNEFSLDYSLKLLKVINGYGEFCAEYKDTFFKPIRFNNTQFQNVRDAYMSSSDYRGPSAILTHELLKQKKLELKESQYKWLFVSVWFGLRPSEIDSCTDKKFHFKIELDKKHKKKVLSIYQSKLRSVSQEKRWKFIPILFKEQEIALNYLNESLERPLNKKLKKIFGPNVRCYSGRKGFTDLMLEKGRKIEEISSWLGHSTIDTTWKFYKDKTKVTLIESA